MKKKKSSDSPTQEVNSKKIKLSDLAEIDEFQESFSEESDDSDLSDGSNFGENEDNQSDARYPSTTSASKPRAKQKNLYAEIPQINNFKETENLFHSNLFRLQVEELLQEMKLSSKKKASLNEWIMNFSEEISQLPSSELFNISDSKFVESWGVKLAIPAFSLNCDWKFSPPEKVEVVGSFVHDMTVSRSIIIDLLVKMPKDGFKNSDYLNQRYFSKRALYLAYLAARIKSFNSISDISYSLVDGNILKPCIIIKPDGKLGKNSSVRILLATNDSLFKLTRFIPVRNNVRSSWLFPSSEDLSDTPTPYYNSLMLQDLLHLDMHKYISQNLTEHQKIKDGIILLKIWLHQRSLDKGNGAFTGFMMTMFVLYLMKKRRISSFMSCYQVARTTWLALAGNEWPESGITLCESEDGLDLDKFSSHFDVIFVDPSGYLNITGCLHKEVFQQVKLEAKLALEYLNNSNVNSFDYLFMTPIMFGLKYDTLIHINLNSNHTEALEKRQSKELYMNLCGDFRRTCLTNILEIIYKAVSPRFSSIGIYLDEKEQWDIHSEFCYDQKITLGLLLDSDKHMDVLTKGPNGDDPQAKEFREFWGEKSNLRRFQDASIREAVVWPGNSTSEKRNIIEHVLKYSLLKHAMIGESANLYICNQLDKVLGLPNVMPPLNLKSYGTGEEANLMLIQSYDSLCSNLRRLKGLPLVITSIQGISPAFRFSQVFPSLPSKCTDEDMFSVENQQHSFTEDKISVPRYIEPHEVLIQLEGSGKWPDEIEAFRRIKAAYYIKIAKLLKEQCFLKTAVYPDSVYVYKDGYVFKVSIACQKEIVLLKTVTLPDGLKTLRDIPESIELKQKIVMLPKITSTLNGLQKKYPAYSAAVRMAKRWMHTQLLGDHFPELIIELIVAKIFIQPAPYNPPNAPIIGFHRFLNLLGSFDWNTMPLMINLNDEFTIEDYSIIQANFNKCRSTLPCMFISSPFDKNSYMTKDSPTLPILHRLMLLSKEASTALSEASMNPISDLDFLKIFRPSFSVYDVLIHLKPNVIPRNYQKMDSKSKQNFKYELKTKDKMPIFGFDPVEFYLNELKEMYNNIALFFYDYLGGDVIGVLFKPNSKPVDSFKISSANFRIPASIDDKQVMKVNFDAILVDFSNLGKGLVKSVERCKI